MSNCKICGKDVCVTCICGYCNECLARYTHKGCKDLEVQEQGKEVKA